MLLLYFWSKFWSFIQSCVIVVLQSPSIGVNEFELDQWLVKFLPEGWRVWLSGYINLYEKNFELTLITKTPSGTVWFLIFLTLDSILTGDIFYTWDIAAYESLSLPF